MAQKITIYKGPTSKHYIFMYKIGDKGKKSI